MSAALPEGVNLFGFLTGGFGLGISARGYLRQLSEAGVPVAAVDVLAGTGRSDRDPDFPSGLLGLGDPTPHPVNLFCMNAGDLARVIGLGAPAIRTRERINACMCFWELSELPPDAIEILEAFDVVLAGSRFDYDCFSRALTGPLVRHVPHPIFADPGAEPDRARWGVPRDGCSFLVSFDLASDFNRKNPLGAVEAFRRAFPREPDVALILKLNNARLEDGWRPYVEALELLAREDPRIRLIDQNLSYAEVLSLYASCDVYVSLHRAEGLGLCLLEAMSLGKPVIATAWSGNMEFTTDSNACLVGYRFVPVEASTQESYRAENLAPGSVWADPKIDQAATWMRTLAGDPELRRRIGARAARDIARRQSSSSPEALLAALGAWRTLHPEVGAAAPSLCGPARVPPTL